MSNEPNNGITKGAHRAVTRLWAAVAALTVAIALATIAGQISNANNKTTQTASALRNVTCSLVSQFHEAAVQEHQLAALGMRKNSTAVQHAAAKLHLQQAAKIDRFVTRLHAESLHC